MGLRTIDTGLFYRLALLALSCLVLVLFLLVPSIKDPALIHSTITANTFFFINGLLLICALWVLTIFFGKPADIRWRMSKIDIFLSVLLLYIIINRYFIQSQHGFSIRFVELLGLGFLYLVLRFIPQKHYLWLLLSIVLSGAAQAVYGNLQLLGYYPSLHSGFNISGSYFNPGPFAGFLAAVWPVALGMYFFKEKITAIVLSNNVNDRGIHYKMVRLFFEYVPLIGMVTIAVVLPATRSRAAWLAVLASTLVLAIYKYGAWAKVKTMVPLKRMILAFITSLVLCAGLYGGYHFKKGSVDGRLLIWKVTSGMVKENLVFGVGHDRFKAHYMNAQAGYFAEHGETQEALVADNSYYTFNEPLQFLAENGLVGLLLSIVFLFYMFRLRTTGENAFLKVCCTGVLVSMIVFGLFSYPAQILPIKMIGVLALALLANIDILKIGFFSKKGKNLWSRFGLWTIKGGLLLAGMALIAAIYPWTKSMEQDFRDWKTALDTYNFGLYEDSLEEFEKAWPTLKSEGDFLMNYGKALTMAEQPQKAIEVLKEAKNQLNTTIIETALGDAYKVLKQYNGAEIAYQHAANMIPIRFYPQYLLANLYMESGQEGKAEAKAREILAKEVKVPSTAIKEIRAEMRDLIKNNLNKDDL